MDTYLNGKIRAGGILACLFETATLVLSVMNVVYVKTVDSSLAVGYIAVILGIGFFAYLVFSAFGVLHIPFLLYDFVLANKKRYGSYPLSALLLSVFTGFRAVFSVIYAVICKNLLCILIATCSVLACVSVVFYVFARIKARLRFHEEKE